MGVFADIIGTAGALVILALAIVGLVALYPSSARLNENGPARARTWLAETHVADLGQHAQTAILMEALRRTGSSARHTAREDSDEPPTP
jgi:hypothetical protein